MASVIKHMALDRGSVRKVDEDGRLILSSTATFKANVCGYHGSEIPDAQRLGLDTNRIYHLLRYPAELARGAARFEGKPLLVLHKVLAADAYPHERVVGSVNNVRSEPPCLQAGLSV